MDWIPWNFNRCHRISMDFIKFNFIGSMACLWILQIFAGFQRFFMDSKEFRRVPSISTGFIELKWIPLNVQWFHRVSWISSIQIESNEFRWISSCANQFHRISKDFMEFLCMPFVSLNDGIHRISMDSIEVQLIIIDLLEFEWMLFN